MSASNVHKKCKMQQFLCVCVCECVQDWIKCTHFVEMCKLDPISMWMLNLHFVKMRRIAINIAIESADSYISTKPILFTRYIHIQIISRSIFAQFTFECHLHWLKMLFLSFYRPFSVEFQVMMNLRDFISIEGY